MIKKITFLLILFSMKASTSHAQDWTIGPFLRPTSSPVITPDNTTLFDDPVTHQPVHWEGLHTFNPGATIAPDGKIAVLYRAEDATGTMRVGGHTSRLGLATSEDGLHFTRLPQPVLFPDNDSQSRNEIPGGVEDPRLVQTSEGLYVLTYTQYARDRHVHTAGTATSTDLKHWSKFGPLFEGASGGRYNNILYKSAGILQRLKDGKLVAAKLHGKYWMYWGEGIVCLATSSDLRHWTPVLDVHTGNPLVLLAPRSGRFDSEFPEMGPPPVLTSKGIVVVYNGKNAGGKLADKDAKLAPDPDLPLGSYSVGEALFSASDPAKLMARTDHPVFKPEQAFERSGQYLDGTTFAEGLVPYKGRWFLYYGSADSFVAVATAPFEP